MPSKMRHGLLISLAVISLITISFNTSYPDTTNYIYDELNRLIRVEYGDGTVTVYTYDETGNRTGLGVGEYTLTVNVVGSGTVTKNPNQPIYSSGTNVTLTAVDGSQTFSEWSGDLSGSTNPTVIEMNGNKSVTATFVTWLQGWTYRKPVTLSRASGAVTNYQMKLKVGETSGASGEDVDCNGHVQADFDDLRFTTSDKTTLLNYWIESITGTTPNQLATIWIKFDSIGTSATTFYMYYGNAGASDASNGANTFIFYEGFEWGSNGDTINQNGWTEAVAHCHISTEQYYGQGTRSAKIIGAAGTGPYCWKNTGITIDANAALQFRLYKETDVSGARFTWLLGTFGLYLLFGSDEQAKYFSLYSNWNDTSTYMLADAWSVIDVFNFDFVNCYADMQIDGGTVKTGMILYQATNTPGYLQFYSQSSSTGLDFWFDNVLVRNWRATGPAWGAWGAEESN